MATIQLEDLRKSYGKIEVIHGVNVDISDAELIVIVGPSGCGKSTLLRMVAGLETVSAGNIHINGRLVNQVEPKDRDIAMVFQTYALYPHMTVFNNMAYGLKIAKVSADEIRQRVGNAADILELTDLLQRKPKELSGGQRQRVAMGRAIVRKPSVFLFDEPLSNLDALLRVQMRLEIKQLQRKLGVTSLYVTHDQVEAMTLADRLIVMNAGVAEQIDSPMAIYQRPASVFVAGFIGSPGMNFLSGRLNNEHSEVILSNNDVIPVDYASLSNDTEQSVMLGMRPEHLQVVSETDGQIALKVIAVETLGADTLAHGFLVPLHKQSNTNRKEKLSVRLTGDTSVKEEETLYLAVLKENLHIFDEKSGRRISQAE